MLMRYYSVFLDARQHYVSFPIPGCKMGTAIYAPKRALFEKNAERAHFHLKI
jgi:hypothetical protein